MRRSIEFSLVALVMVGCSCGSPSAPAASAAPTPAPPSSAAPASSAPPPPSTPTAAARARPTPPSAADRARMRTELAEGRRLAQSGDAAGALPHFQAALQAVPDPRARCEAGFVAHQAGQDEVADQLVSQALHELPSSADTVPTNMRVPLAMCLYNAGLVFEARGDTDHAADAYGRSIALRPNATVQTALDRVGAPTTPPTTGPLATLVDAHRVSWCADAGIECPASCAESSDALPDVSGLDDTGSCRTQTLAGGAIAGTPGFEAVLFESSTFQAGALALVLGSGEQRNWIALAESNRPGAEMGLSASYEIGSIAWQDVIPGGPAELVIAITSHNLNHQWLSDDDDGNSCDDVHTDDWATTYVCGSDGAGIHCVAITTSQRTDDTHACTPPESDEPVAGASEYVVEWAIDLRFENGQAIGAEHTPFSSSFTAEAAESTGASVPTPAEYQARLGAHDLAALLRDHPCNDICGP